MPYGLKLKPCCHHISWAFSEQICFSKLIWSSLFANWFDPDPPFWSVWALFSIVTFFMSCMHNALGNRHIAYDLIPGENMVVVIWSCGRLDDGIICLHEINGTGHGKAAEVSAMCNYAQWAGSTELNRKPNLIDIALYSSRMYIKAGLLSQLSLHICGNVFKDNECWNENDRLPRCTPPRAHTLFMHDLISYSHNFTNDICRKQFLPWWRPVNAINMLAVAFLI